MSVYRKGGISLYLGAYEDVLRHVTDECTLITDTPYSRRVHMGHRAGVVAAEGWARSNGKLDVRTDRRVLGYDGWGCEEVTSFCERWGHVRGWAVCLSDSELVPTWRASMEALGRTGFHPLPCVIRGMTVRMAGDGPSSWAIYANVSRPKSLLRWGTLPGAYDSPQGERVHIGGKPLALMRALVRDYSRPGDTIVDPCAGGATTLIAAALEGRRAIGAELDPETYALACARIERHALTPPLPGLDVERRRPEQTGLAIDPEAAE